MSETFESPADTGADAETQADIDAEIAAMAKEYEQAGEIETQPRLDYPAYRSSLLRHPTKAPEPADPEGVELWAPVFGERDVDPLEADLTIGHRGEPVGERMIVTGLITDSQGRPVRRQLVEIWQANAGGRYVHLRDQHPAPLDPNFTGIGPLPHRRPRQLPFHHDPTRPLSLAQSPQCLAARAHPLLVVRDRLHHADGDPDVLPGRPALRLRSDLSVDP